MNHTPTILYPQTNLYLQKFWSEIPKLSQVQIFSQVQYKNNNRPGQGGQGQWQYPRHARAVDETRDTTARFYRLPVRPLLALFPPTAYLWCCNSLQLFRLKPIGAKSKCLCTSVRWRHPTDVPNLFCAICSSAICEIFVMCVMCVMRVMCHTCVPQDDVRRMQVLCVPWDHTPSVSVRVCVFAC